MLSFFFNSNQDEPMKTSDKKIARWCNGSTTDSGSVCLGSSPGRAASEIQSLRRTNGGFFVCKGEQNDSRNVFMAVGESGRSSAERDVETIGG